MPVLHTTDEFSTAVDGSGNAIPSHVIGFPTLDPSVSPAGGGKLGVYSFWPITDSEGPLPIPPGSTSPDTQPDQMPPNTGQDFEFYDYTGNQNYAEAGNDYSGAGTPQTFITAFGNIRNGELYTLPGPVNGYTGGIDFSTPYSAALSLYRTWVTSPGNNVIVAED
jgi:hypothetical protein